MLTEHEIQEYTRSGETRDKAGAYAIQGWASRFVTQIQGCYHNVVGLPVSLVYSHLKIAMTRHLFKVRWLVAEVAGLLPLLVFAARDNSLPDWKQQGVIFLEDSPNARQHPVPVQAVHMGDGFLDGSAEGGD